jgi:hypothetical protein
MRPMACMTFVTSCEELSVTFDRKGDVAGAAFLCKSSPGASFAYILLASDSWPIRPDFDKG